MTYKPFANKGKRIEIVIVVFLVLVGLYFIYSNKNMIYISYLYFLKFKSLIPKDYLMLNDLGKHGFVRAVRAENNSVFYMRSFDLNNDDSLNITGYAVFKIVNVSNTSVEIKYNFFSLDSQKNEYHQVLHFYDYETAYLNIEDMALSRITNKNKNSELGTGVAITGFKDIKFLYTLNDKNKIYKARADNYENVTFEDLKRVLK